MAHKLAQEKKLAEGLRERARETQLEEATLRAKHAAGELARKKAAAESSELDWRLQAELLRRQQEGEEQRLQG